MTLFTYYAMWFLQFGVRACKFPLIMWALPIIASLNKWFWEQYGIWSRDREIEDLKKLSSKEAFRHR